MKASDLLLTKKQIDKISTPCSTLDDNRCNYPSYPNGCWDCKDLTITRQASLKTAKAINSRLKYLRSHNRFSSFLLMRELSSIIQETEDSNITKESK